MTRAEFTRAMRAIVDDPALSNPQGMVIEAVNFMCAALIDLGFDEGIEIFRRNVKLSELK